MLNKKPLQEFPIRRIAPVDGMAVTAQVWEEAHAYHRQRQRAHDLLRHGPGIVTGLEVIASDPPDAGVYVQPGIAIDPCGETIILTNPVAYDIGAARGLLYLLLSYEESRPTIEQESSPPYVYAQFGIAAGPGLAGDSGVELARVRRPEGGAPIRNARDPEFPGPNEVDMRFRQGRQWPAAAISEAASLAVCYTGGGQAAGRTHGAASLARALRHAGRPVWVDDQVPLGSGLEGYTLVYVVVQGDFRLSRDEASALYAHLKAGGTALIESCRRTGPEGNRPADAAVSELLSSMGFELAEVQAGHRLLTEPHLFAAVPPGFESGGTGRVLAGGGAILSTCDYGCLWQGVRRGAAPSREEIRTAMEWGENLISYALARRREAHSA